MNAHGQAIGRTSPGTSPQGSGKLYADHVKVYPQRIWGRFRKLKWTALAVLLGRVVPEDQGAIQRRGVEFACGLAPYDDGLLISYGVGDRSSYYCVLPSAHLTRWIVG